MGRTTNIDDAYAITRRWIREGTSFARGKLFASTIDPEGYDYYGDTGVLPEEWWQVLVDNEPDYIVWSDGTPIAWHYRVTELRGNGPWTEVALDRWVIPPVGISRAVSVHQRVVHDALVLATPITSLNDERLRG
jgi:hypothetical protein